MARRYQQTSSCQRPRGGQQGTEGSCSLSPHLAPASALAVAAGAAPLWAYGIINRDQCSLEDSALTGQCHYWTLSIVRQRATTPEGVGESIGSCRGTVTGCLIVVWFRRDRCYLNSPRAVGGWRGPASGERGKTGTPPPNSRQLRTPKRCSSSVVIQVILIKTCSSKECFRFCCFAQMRVGIGMTFLEAFWQ